MNLFKMKNLYLQIENWYFLILRLHFIEEFYLFRKNVFDKRTRFFRTASRVIPVNSNYIITSAKHAREHVIISVSYESIYRSNYLLN